jgi:hypothetical protein
MQFLGTVVPSMICATRRLDADELQIVDDALVLGL